LPGEDKSDLSKATGYSSNSRLAAAGYAENPAGGFTAIVNSVTIYAVQNLFNDWYWIRLSLLEVPMKRLSVGDPAPDFSLPDHEGRQVRLSEINRQQNVLLVFNIGFVWPHCTNHMAQLRHDYQHFQALQTEILVMVPNGPKTIARYLHNHDIPYPILSDKGLQVAGRYFQVKRFLLAGTPTVMLVDKTGHIAYAHYATSLVEEPDNQEPLAVLSGLTG
jgi:peroxiredoxin Q/BCP